METPEQAPSTPPPKRCRRGLTVSVVLVLVSSVAWWYWPRGDARFVGKWSRQRSAEFAPIEMMLKSNGSAIIVQVEGGSKVRCSWELVGDRLNFGPSIPIPIGNVAGAINRVAGRKLFLDQDFSLKNVKVMDADHLWMTDLMNWGIATYRRIPE